MPKTTFDLTGKWEFKEYPLSARKMSDLETSDWLPANVPSSIFTNLVEADKIKQSDLDANPENFSWVSQKPWIYRKTFDVSDNLLNCDKVNLVFDGLDTIATIWLNEKLIARTDNMFIPFEFDVKKDLKPKENSLLVKFEPAIQYAENLMERYISFSESDFRNPYRAYIRKAQFQFGWDFCPALPGCGIWRPVRLQGVEKARLSDLQVRTIDCNNDYADIKITAELDTITKEKFTCNLTLSHGNQTIEHKLILKPTHSHSTVIRIENPALWWPAGYGEQNLYLLKAELQYKNKVIDQIQKHIGIRTVKLNRSTDKYGEKFRFEINDQPIHTKGANWIPPSIYAGSVKYQEYEKLLNSAVDANINMLRIWGGGHYESEDFYNLCDRLGIMVWQDFMFACAYYPDKDWFIDEIKKEAAKIIKLLRNHPCLILWCGNNEIDWLHSQGKLGKNKKFYGKPIFHKILPHLIEQLDPDRSYIPSTPIGPAKDINHPKSGTVHQWETWTNHKPIYDYICSPSKIPRFVTEFGFQSLPNIETIKNIYNLDNLHISSKSIEKHNYQLGGNSRLYHYIGDLFGTVKNLEQFIYMSQITQARTIKRYIEKLRANRPINSGVLFWQLNDCCPAISWSAIDYNKHPKALYYYAKRFFSKHLITVVPETKLTKFDLPPQIQSLNIFAVNDSPEPLTAKLNCNLIDLFGRTIDQITFPLALTPFSNSPPLKLPKAFVQPVDPANSVLHLSMYINEERTIENLFFYLPDKHIDWPKTKITTELKKINEKSWKLKLKSNAVTTDVQITPSIPCTLSNNFINLIPPNNTELEIDFQTQRQSSKPFIKVSSVQNLFETD